MECELHVYTCDKKGCEERHEETGYAADPRGWIRIEFEAPSPDRGTRHFCSWAHAASFCSLRAADEARRR